MQPTIVTLQPKKLIGQRMTMSMADYRIGELMRGFGPKRKEIRHTVNTDLISMAIYTPEHFVDYSPTRLFERWAAMEVSSYEFVPPNMKTFDLSGGLYAVFHYKGLPADPAIFQYIFGQWLPHSSYVLDDRPHFEVLGAKYNTNDPNSEEDICIPIRE